jgi:CHASE1-domain containing sensor protein
MTKFRRTFMHHKRALYIAIAFVLVLSIVATFYAQARLINRSDGHFHDDVGHITKSLVKDAENYNSVLYGARSFMTSSREVTQDEWDNFFRTQDTLNRHPGISTVSYIEVVPKTEKQLFEARMRSIPYFEDRFSIKDTGTRLPEYAVASLISTDNDISNALGFDNYSTEDRRSVYAAAQKNNMPIASQPIKLATGSLRFFIALPVYQEERRVKGFVALSFRAEDFTNALFGDNLNLIAGQITDITNKEAPISLYGSKNWSTTPNELVRTETVLFGSRTWELQFKTQRSYNYPLLNKTVPYLILLTGGLAIALLILGRLSYTAHKRSS